ncbi:MAG TPA: ISAzo13 family transposase [Candidatus Tectomicrobia bacterium]
MEKAVVEAIIREKFVALAPVMDERTRRRWAATEANALGHSGQTLVARATGMSRSTLHLGLRELERDVAPALAPGPRVRRRGAGRKALTERDPTLVAALETLVEPTSRGDPQSPLRWTCMRVRQLATALHRQGHTVERQTVAHLLAALGYSWQAHRKTKEGPSHPDRNAQFADINTRVRAFQKRGYPVVSVETNKKELVGDFKNGGQEWRPQGQPAQVRVDDFVDADWGNAIPDGVYDQAATRGWVHVGVDHDTAALAVESLRRWWEHMGSQRYPRAPALLMTADGGGSNGSRSRLWKVALQQLANDMGLRMAVGHFPPGTSNWNTIEHRMFSHMSMNWRGRPLISHEVMVNLIAKTTTQQGLTIKAALDTGRSPRGIKGTDQEFEKVKLKHAKFHGEWNYTIMPMLSSK